MVLFLIEIAKYLNLILAGFYTLIAFLALKRADDDGRMGIFRLLETLVYILFSSGIASLALARYNEGDNVAVMQVITAGAAELICLFIYMRAVYHFYPELNRLLLVNMCFLLTVGFVVQMRLSYPRALRQAVITAVSLVIAAFIPVIIYRFRWMKKFGIICGILGFVSLAAVFLMGSIVNGARLSVTIAGFTFQASEFAKILFAFLMAGLLSKHTDKKNIGLSVAAAASYMIILVLSKDLGMALIFFLMFMAMLCMGTGRGIYMLPALMGVMAAGALGYVLFDHVRVRVHAWIDPWTDIDKTGYQLSQSLFALGTGGFFGRGIGRGKPYTIPDVAEDFVFSAICEESGALFGIFLMLIFLNTIMVMLLVAAHIKDRFYKITAMGLSVCFGTQTVLTIGGGTRFIPLTGVTLPFVSNGGSSCMATCFLFAVMQGISLLHMDDIYGSVEDEEYVGEEFVEEDYEENIIEDDFYDEDLIGDDFIDDDDN